VRISRSLLVLLYKICVHSIGLLSGPVNHCPGKFQGHQAVRAEWRSLAGDLADFHAPRFRWVPVAGPPAEQVADSAKRASQWRQLAMRFNEAASLTLGQITQPRSAPAVLRRHIAKSFQLMRAIDSEDKECSLSCSTKTGALGGYGAIRLTKSHLETRLLLSRRPTAGPDSGRRTVYTTPMWLTRSVLTQRPCRLHSFAAQPCHFLSALVWG